MSQQEMESRIAELEARVAQMDLAMFSVWATFLKRMNGANLYDFPLGTQRYLEVLPSSDKAGQYLVPKRKFPPEGESGTPA